MPDAARVPLRTRAASASTKENPPRSPSGLRPRGRPNTTKPPNVGGRYPYSYSTSGEAHHAPVQGHAMKNAQRLDPRVTQWVVQAATRLTSTFAIVQGVAIVGGGPARWQGPAFATALTVPGAPGSWGIALFLFGAAGLAGTFIHRERLVAAAMALICAWCMFFAMSFAKTAHENPRAATTGIWAYAFICLTALLLAGAYLQSQGGQDVDELAQ